MHTVFLHPDLGIGGAERAMIDAALSLKSNSHSVEFVTSHHDKAHCFEETKDGSFHVTSVGDWLPRNIFGYCYALCAYVRMIYAAIYLVFFSHIQYDIVVCDQISACIPVLKYGHGKILFYCHFPDMLLTKRQSSLKKLYRAPIDRVEEYTTGMADRVLVNSKFTAKVFEDTFHSLSHIKPDVLYPIPDFSAFQKEAPEPDATLMPEGQQAIFLSINRYERKKNLNLAIQAFAVLQKKLTNGLENIHLIMAGGYDDRVLENKEHFQELKQLTVDLQVEEHVSFLRSFSDEQKRTLLKYSTCLIYTPHNEHFGIVPVEAMYMKCPVIAVASGGPLETVSDKKTGYLCEGNAESFANAMNAICSDKSNAEKMGRYGHTHVIEKFSFETFTAQLDGIVSGLVSKQ